MIFFFIVFLIIGILILGLDKYFYRTIFAILETKNIDSGNYLKSLGYYNKSIFSNRLYGLLITLAISLLIFIFYKYFKRRERIRVYKKIKALEADLARINKGDYRLELEGDDEFSSLRDQVYKIVVSLKSMEKEAERQKIVLKRDLSNIAHQLKTPITSIGFMAELIEEDRENTGIYLEKLYLELDRLKDFTEILLKLSKLNSKTIEYKLVNLSIREILEDLLNKLNRDSKVEVEIRGEDFYILGDEIWLYEAFLNIIKNSLDHTKDRVEIDLIHNPIYKLVRISDNGQGLDGESLKKIFDRFYRGDTTIPGYGIGLNLAKSIIEDHKAEIRAYKSGGLVFEIKFYNVT